MNKKYPFFILFLISFQRFNSLRSNDFCNLVKKECKGVYDSNDNYKVDCQQDSCPKSHIYSCGETRCAKNLTKCKNYLEITADTNRFSSRFRRSFLEIKYKEKVKNFERKMPNCTSKQYVYKTSDVCFRVRNCFKKDEIKFAFDMNGMKMYLKQNTNRFDCPCKGSLTFVCNHNRNKYCSLNQYACDSFNSEHNKSSYLISIRKCRNNFLILN